MADTTPNDVRPMADAPLRFEAPARKMDLATLLGLAAALTLIGLAIVLNGSPLAFIDIPAILMVVLGTFAVTTISYTGEELREAQPSFRQALLRTEIDPRVGARRVLTLADKARKRGLLSLQADLYGLRDAPFLQRSLGMLVDGLQVDEIERNMTLEAHAIAQGRHRAAAILRRAAEVSPAMGLIGTLVGLVQMLGSLDSPERIGPAMSLALLTTLYGALMANVVFLPLASKLERNATVEQLVSQVYTMGVASMGRQENPRRLEMLLNTVLPAGQQIRYFD
ncbi:motility protein A [Dongia deserti]|uniref:motility protein A n=1 Tax=Dongia deserti TaxID=2268030 RepID=UPI002548AFCD|nr:MotA/TolQ/ExbB proton channel family protein [Dongia deserti]